MRKRAVFVLPTRARRLAFACNCSGVHADLSESAISVTRGSCENLPRGMGELMIPRRSFDERHVDLWREQICDELLDAEAPWSDGQRFDLELGVTVVSGVVHLDMASHAPGLTLARSPERINRESRRDAIGLTYVTAGEAEIANASSRHMVRTGELCLLSSEEPFEKTLSADYAELFFYVPVPIIRALGRPVPNQTMLVSNCRGLGGVLRDALISLSKSSADLDHADWDAGLRAMLALTAGVFGRTEPSTVEHGVRDVWRKKIVRYIDEHLGDSTLAPPAIAAALGISLRYLHLIFTDAELSVAATILVRRLDRCRVALVDQPARSISEIAYAHGFNDAAHFSRTFKARFGFSPRELRSGRLR